MLTNEMIHDLDIAVKKRTESCIKTLSQKQLEWRDNAIWNCSFKPTDFHTIVSWSFDTFGTSFDTFGSTFDTRLFEKFFIFDQN